MGTPNVNIIIRHPLVFQSGVHFDSSFICHLGRDPVDTVRAEGPDREADVDRQGVVVTLPPPLTLCLSFRACRYIGTTRSRYPEFVSEVIPSAFESEFLANAPTEKRNPVALPLYLLLLLL